MKKALILLLLLVPTSIRAQCTVAIPPNAIVVDTTMGSSGVGKSFWICKNDTLTGSGVDMTYFMEQGSSFTGSGIDKNVYMKTLSSISGSGIDDSIWHEAGVNISISNPYTQLCPVIVFDYADAPVPGCAIATGTPDSRDVVRVRMYPNPAREYVRIEPGMPGMSLLGISILQLHGPVVYQGDRVTGGRQEIDLSGMSPGTYMVRVLTTVGTAIHFLTIAP